MSEDELLSLAEDRPNKNKPYQSSFYGLDKCLKKYAFFPQKLPLYIENDHGVGGYSEKPSMTELRTNAPFFLFHGERLAKEWITLTKTPCAVMGSPFAYYRKIKKIKKKKDCFGTVSFPSHGTHWIDCEIDWKLYCNLLKKLPDVYQPVSVCLYWTEVNKGVYKVFFDEGISVFTAGHMFDNMFVDRFYEILSQHKFSTSNLMQSCAYYSIEMGIPFFLYGENLQINIFNNGDPNFKLGSLQSEEHVRWIFGNNKLFSTPTTEISDEQIKFVESEMGTHTSLSRWQLSVLLWCSYLLYLKNVKHKKIPHIINILINFIINRLKYK